MYLKKRILIWVLYTAAVSVIPSLAAMPKPQLLPAVFLQESAPVFAVNQPAAVVTANQPAFCNPAVRYDDGVVVHGCSVNASRPGKRCGPIRRLLKIIFRRNRR